MWSDKKKHLHQRSIYIPPSYLYSISGGKRPKVQTNNKIYLKVDSNDSWGGSGRRQMAGNGLGLWRSMIICVLTCSFCVKTQFQFLLIAYWRIEYSLWIGNPPSPSNRATMYTILASLLLFLLPYRASGRMPILADGMVPKTYFNNRYTVLHVHEQLHYKKKKSLLLFIKNKS